MPSAVGGLRSCACSEKFTEAVVFVQRCPTPRPSGGFVHLPDRTLYFLKNSS